jgi:predicted histone-like DNA-binding protein
MALKIKARERLFKVGKFAGTYRYVMQPDLYSALTQEKVIREAALRSGVSEGVMHACWDAACEVIEAWATEGHSVALPGLGTMRFSLSAKSVADVNDVKSSLIKTRRIVFTPSVELKEELKSTSVIITCYDRNGEIVKRVTSTDDGTIEDNSGEDTTGENDGGNTPSGGGSQNQGGTQGRNTSQGGDEGGDEPFDGGN